MFAFTECLVEHSQTLRNILIFLYLKKSEDTKMNCILTSDKCLRTFDALSSLADKDRLDLYLHFCLLRSHHQTFHFVMRCKMSSYHLHPPSTITFFCLLISHLGCIEELFNTFHLASTGRMLIFAGPA